MTTDDATSAPPPPIPPQQSATGPAAQSASAPPPDAPLPRRTFFWTVWNILKTPGNAVFSRLAEWPLSATVGGLLIIGTTAGMLYYFSKPITDFLTRAENGKIIVNSPTVFTRQRLVNDRLEQTRWLRTQLALTEEQREKDFKSIDAVRQSIIDTKVRGGAGGTNEPSKDGTQPNNNADIAVEETTMSLFRAKNAYREEVRSELTQTELDDRHDIKGNTIYRLTFDTSIVAGTREGSVAVIGVQLRHHPIEAKGPIKPIYDDDYRNIYEDWARKFQDTINTSMSGVSASLFAAVPQENLRLLFADFLLNRICEIVSGKIEIERGPEPCPRDTESKARFLLKSYTEKRSKSLDAIQKVQFRQAMQYYRNDGRYLFPPGDDNFEYLINAASRLCSQNNFSEISLGQLNIFEKPPLPTSTANVAATTTLSANSSNGTASEAASAPQTNDSQKSQQLRDNRSTAPQRAKALIGCPFYDSLKERLISGVLLYEKLLAIATRAYSEGKDAEIPAANDYDAYTSRATADASDPGACQAKGICFVNPAQMRCFAADFLKSKLNGFAQNQKLTIDKFFTLQIVGREVNDCNILVTARPKDATAANNFNDFSAFFEHSLNQNTDAFAYSVTPKNLAENISTAAETRDAFELIARAKETAPEIGSFLRKRSERNRAVIAHPIVVGFGSSDFRHLTKTKTPPDGVRDIDFGWIVAGRLATDKAYSQIDGQYALSAFISVPGWWQTVEASIVRCWISRTELAGLTQTANAINICPERTKSLETTVRLPGAIPEISHKLGFDVIQQPSIMRPRERELVVGRHGSLLLEGQRLWRSTEVTAGDQRADKITVLPNMEGILATFYCVEPPAGARQSRENESVRGDEAPITRDFARVWTSEGVTELVPLVFVWPKGSHVDDELCPDKNEKTASSVVKGKKKQDPNPNKQNSGVTPPPPP